MDIKQHTEKTIYFTDEKNNNNIIEIRYNKKKEYKRKK